MGWGVVDPKGKGPVQCSATWYQDRKRVAQGHCVGLHCYTVQPLCFAVLRWSQIMRSFCPFPPPPRLSGQGVK